jgi:ATP-dependent Clp protease ATP-binding subunit ClpB
LQAILEIQLGNLRKLLTERKLSLELSTEAKALVVERGTDEIYGARPLKRAVVNLIANPLASALLGKPVREGGVIGVEVEKGELVFRM